MASYLVLLQTFDKCAVAGRSAPPHKPRLEPSGSGAKLMGAAYEACFRYCRNWRATSTSSKVTDYLPVVRSTVYC